MTTCYPTPYQNKINPFGDKVVMYEDIEFCETTETFDYLLMETGEFLLQENGDKIIL